MTKDIPVFAAVLAASIGRGGGHRGRAARPVRTRQAGYLSSSATSPTGMPGSPPLPWRQIPVAHDARERGHGLRNGTEGRCRGDWLGVPGTSPRHPDRAPPEADR